METVKTDGSTAIRDEMKMINALSRRELCEEEVYTFTLTLCDNEIDRDFECFSPEALKKLSSRLYWIDGLEGIFSTSGLSYNGSLLPFYCETSQSNGVHIYGYYSDLAEYLEHPDFYFIPTNLVQNYTPSGIQTSGQATFTNYTLSEPYDASSSSRQSSGPRPPACM